MAILIITIIVIKIHRPHTSCSHFSKTYNPERLDDKKEEMEYEKPCCSTVHLTIFNYYMVSRSLFKQIPFNTFHSYDRAYARELFHGSFAQDMGSALGSVIKYV